MSIWPFRRKKKRKPRRRATIEDKIRREDLRLKRYVADKAIERSAEDPDLLYGLIEAEYGFKIQRRDEAAVEREKLEVLVLKMTRQAFEADPRLIGPIVHQEVKNQRNALIPEEDRDRRTPVERQQDNIEYFEQMGNIVKRLRGDDSWLDVVAEVIKVAAPLLPQSLSSLSSKGQEPMVPIEVDGVTRLIPKADRDRLLAEGKAHYAAQPELPAADIPGENEVPPDHPEADSGIPPASDDGQQPPAGGACEED